MTTKEQYANRFNVNVTETAAGTETFVEVPTYVSAFSKEAFVIHRLEYAFSALSLAALVANNDMVTAALTTSNLLPYIDPVNTFDEPALQDCINISADLVGAAANVQFVQQPFIHNFTDLPGGGIIVPARPLYVAIQSSGIAQACSVAVRGWFTRLELKPDEFLELLDAYRLIT